MLSAMLGFVATGIAALIQFKRSTGVALGSNQRRLILATMPGSFAGALTLAIVPERATLTILALLLAATGLRVLVGQELAHKRQERNGRSTVLTGGFAGFASALTGTGGTLRSEARPVGKEDVSNVRSRGSPYY